MRLTFATIVILLATSIFAAAGPIPYIITNDDNLVNTATFYTIDPSGGLTQAALIDTGGFGISGGFFGMSRVATLENQTASCIFVSNAGSGDVTGIDDSTLNVTGNFFGSANDQGTSNGIGLAVNNKYLYASYSDSNTIGAFKVKSGCKLKFLGDTSVVGLKGGIISGMALRGNILVTSYGDGSIESFDISAGIAVSNGDKQNSTAAKKSFIYPNGIDISKDGHYAIFGDTANSTVVEVSDISSGKLTPTIPYHLGKTPSSSYVRLSPDQTLLYIVNTQGDKVTAAFFDKATGNIKLGCRSNFLKGWVKKWSYLGGVALGTNQGIGGSLYVAEFGGPSYLAVVDVTSSGGQCTLKESPVSPITDGNSFGLLSVGSFPPRSF